MERSEILKKVQEAFCDVLRNDDIELREDMGPNDVEDWNSLALTQILTELEKEFGIRFSLAELITIKDVGSIIDAINARLQ